jgi:quinol monooxygenase YgiN
MTVTRINHFEAKPGSEDKLQALLRSVISVILDCPGAVSCKLLRSVEKHSSFAIIEKWDSIEAHQRAAKAIPPEKMAEATALFAKPPVGEYYQ